VVAPLAAETVHAAVIQLAQRLIDTGAVSQPDRLDRLFTEVRVRDVIHVGDRVLLPHLRTDAVDGLVVAIGVAPRPLRASDEDDTAEAQVVLLVLAPPAAAGVYLQAVAALARALRDDGVVDALIRAGSPAEVLAIPAMQGITIQPRLQVRDVMSQRVHRVSPDDTVEDVMRLVKQYRLRAVPVVDEERSVLGMVTDRDLLRHFLPGVQRPEDNPAAVLRSVKVRDVMSRSVICLSEDQALADVASVMAAKDLERLPVTLEGKLTGFLTRGDILRKLFALT
jgi:CBS domain-containing protein